VISLFLITIIIDFHIEFFIGNIDNFVVKIYISDGFIDLILIPIIRNETEHLTVVIGIFKSKMDFAIEIIFRFDVQIAVFLFPIIILIDWIMDITNMILIFDDFQCYNLLVSPLILFPILLTADIRKSENDFRASNKLKIINRFSDIPFLFLYNVIAVIAFFFI
jgi:Ca2+:H+ antiporter